MSYPVNKPAAVIDKSLLHAICEQNSENRNASFRALFDHYHIVVSLVLIEEIWANLASPTAKTPPDVLANMKDFLISLHHSWIAEPLEISFLELVKGESIKPLPRPAASLVHSFSILPPNDPLLVKWMEDRASQRKTNIRHRVEMFAAIQETDQFESVENGRDFFERFIRGRFVEMLSDPVRKRDLLERELGLAFRGTHPEWSKEIDEAFSSYSKETFADFQATLMCLIAGMFYFYAPLCKLVSRDNGNRPLKILGRGFRDQFNNLADQRYVQSALLCDRLLTRDEEMHNVMELLRDSGFWDGVSVFIDPKEDVGIQIPRDLL